MREEIQNSINQFHNNIKSMNFIQFQQPTCDDEVLPLKMHRLTTQQSQFRFISHLQNRQQLLSLQKQKKSQEQKEQDVSAKSKFALKRSVTNTPLPKQQACSNEETQFFQYLNKREPGHRQSNVRKKITIQKKLSELGQWNGNGIVRLNDGKVVMGNWKNGQLVGCVKILYETKDIYIGEVLNYKRHGNGILCYTNGCKYQGNFINGKFDGFGIFYDKYGEVESQGIWKKGELIVRQD